MEPANLFGLHEPHFRVFLREIGLKLPGRKARKTFERAAEGLINTGDVPARAREIGVTGLEEAAPPGHLQTAGPRRENAGRGR